MKSNSLILGFIVTLISVVVLFGFSLSSTNAVTLLNFSVNVTISGNAAPIVTWVQSGISINPVEASNRTVMISFNITDNNGYDNINYSSARVILTYAGEQIRSSYSCANVANGSLNMQINCSVNMRHFDRDGSWTINVTADDFSSSRAEDTATTLTYGQLQAATINKNGIIFGSTTLGSNTGSTNDPLVVNNTGNQNFTHINVTGFNLVGQGNPTQYIAASNIYVNSSLDNFGNALSNNTKVQLSNSTLARDVNGNDYSRNLYFWMSVPAAGLSNQDYVSSSNWLLEVN